VDEKISAKVIDYLDRNGPKKTNKPFFIWYNPARMHITTVLPPKNEAMIGELGVKTGGRKFRCIRCDNIDPMQVPDFQAWAKSELRSPKTT
jgi:hypothetical protein